MQRPILVYAPSDMPGVMLRAIFLAPLKKLDEAAWAPARGSSTGCN